MGEGEIRGGEGSSWGRGRRTIGPLGTENSFLHLVARFYIFVGNQDGFAKLGHGSGLDQECSGVSRPEREECRLLSNRSWKGLP